MGAKRSPQRPPAAKRGRSLSGNRADDTTQVLGGAGGKDAIVGEASVAHAGGVDADCASAAPEHVTDATTVDASVPQPQQQQPEIPFFCAVCLSTNITSPAVLHASAAPASAYGLCPAGATGDAAAALAEASRRSPVPAPVPVRSSNRTTSPAAQQQKQPQQPSPAAASPLFLPTACLACQGCAQRWARQALKEACGEALGMRNQQRMSAARSGRHGGGGADRKKAVSSAASAFTPERVPLRQHDDSFNGAASAIKVVADGGSNSTASSSLSIDEAFIIGALASSGDAFAVSLPTGATLRIAFSALVSSAGGKEKEEEAADDNDATTANYSEHAVEGGGTALTYFLSSAACPVCCEAHGVAFSLNFALAADGSLSALSAAAAAGSGAAAEADEGYAVRIVLAALRAGALLSTTNAAASNHHQQGEGTESEGVVTAVWTNPFASLGEWCADTSVRFNTITGAYSPSAEHAPDGGAVGLGSSASLRSSTLAAASAVQRHSSSPGAKGTRTSGGLQQPPPLPPPPSDAVILNWYTGSPPESGATAGAIIPIAIGSRASGSGSGSAGGAASIPAGASATIVPLCASPMKQRLLLAASSTAATAAAAASTHAEEAASIGLLERRPSLLAGGAILRLNGSAPADIIGAARESSGGGGGAAGSDAAALCGSCEEAAGTSDCVECGFPLCEGCLRATHSRGRYKSHRILPIGHAGRTKGRRCAEHSDQLLELYCYDCRTCVCVRCCFAGGGAGATAVGATHRSSIIMGGNHRLGSIASGSGGSSASPMSAMAGGGLQHGGHVGHNVVPLAEVVASIAEAVAESSRGMATWQKRAAAASRALRSALPIFSKCEAAVRGDISRHFAALQLALQRSEAEALRSVGRYVSAQTAAVAASAGAFAESAAEAEALRAAMAKVAEETHPTVAVQLQASVMRRAEAAAAAVSRIGELAVAASSVSAAPLASASSAFSSPLLFFDPNVSHILSTSVTANGFSPLAGDDDALSDIDNADVEEEVEEEGEGSYNAAAATSAAALGRLVRRLPPPLQLLLAPIVPDLSALVFVSAGGGGAAAAADAEGEEDKSVDVDDSAAVHPLLRQAISSSFALRYPPLPIASATSVYLANKGASEERENHTDGDAARANGLAIGETAAALFQCRYEALVAAMASEEHGAAAGGVDDDNGNNEECLGGNDEDCGVDSPRRGYAEETAAGDDSSVLFDGHHSAARSPKQRHQHQQQHYQQQQQRQNPPIQQSHQQQHYRDDDRHYYQQQEFEREQQQQQQQQARQQSRFDRPPPAAAATSAAQANANAQHRGLISEADASAKHGRHHHNHREEVAGEFRHAAHAHNGSPRYRNDTTSTAAAALAPRSRPQTAAPMPSLNVEGYGGGTPNGAASAAVAPTLAPSPPTRGAAAASNAPPRSSNGGGLHQHHGYGAGALDDEDDDHSIGLMVGGGGRGGGQQARTGRAVTACASSSSTAAQQPPIAAPKGRPTLGGIARIFQLGSAAAPTVAAVAAPAGAAASETASVPQRGARRGAPAASPSRPPTSPTSTGAAGALGGIQLHI